MSYPSYPEYKDSCVRWLGLLPAHWEIVRNKRAFRIVNRPVGENSSQYQLLSLTLKGIIPRNLDGKGKFPAEFDSYQVVEPGNLVFCLFDIDETPRTVGLSDKSGMVTGVYTVVEPINSAEGGFLYYYYLSVDLRKGLRPFYTGLRKVVRPQTFMNLDMPFPPAWEQAQIARFLDHQTARIDALIAEQQRLIELLKEKRQAMISHTVTKGLDPDVAMKDSGVEWLGEIPEHWEVKKLKYLGEAIIGLTYAPEDITDSDQGILVLRSSNIQNGRISLADTVYVKKSIPKRLLTKNRDILICSRNGSKELIGKNALITKDLAGATFGAFMTVYRTEYAEFLNYIFNSHIFEAQSGAFMTSTVNQLTTGILNNFQVPLPSVDQQEEITQELDREMAKFDALSEEAENLVAILKERRSALISAAVTGKIDVRDWEPPVSETFPQSTASEEAPA